ncbi:DUF805 domain-containing protein [Rhizobium paranaense]|uniref:Uncharacterized membrane protein YhaH (DUF805 family) n=1 Tax=Rhizobium paranaense TaxID=1650438 RepID=A0A7W8XUF3_9HYPH|nr:DUF805 domain-containing protein [Rhizobium paranaense]MBB5575800.1 uncharacterized membrane protein YhaH (DUF805 family) [Rhizobium paranaense]
MIGNLFCFQGRIGRLKYFLWGYIFLPGAIFLTMLILPFLFIFGFHFDGSKTTALMIVVPAVAVFLWTHLSLQVARIRDIGWNPMVIVPAMLSLDVVDVTVGYLFPALALGTKHYTIVSEVINAVYTIALLFTPGDGDYAVPAIVFPEIPLPKSKKGIFRSTRSDAATPAEPPRPSSGMPRPADARGQVSFGRRGLVNDHKQS